VVVPTTVAVNPPTTSPTGQSPAVAAVRGAGCGQVVGHGIQAANVAGHCTARVALQAGISLL